MARNDEQNSNPMTFIKCHMMLIAPARQQKCDTFYRYLSTVYLFLLRIDAR